MYVGYYFDTPGCARGGLSPCFNRLTITAMSQNIANNSTTFSWKINVRNVAGSGTRWTYTGLGFWVDGGSEFFSSAKSGSEDNIWPVGEQRASGTKTVYHNADGTKSVTLALRDMFSGFYSDARWGNYSTSRDSNYCHQASVTLSLPTIPRASTPTMSTTNFNIGSSSTIYTNRLSGAFTHSIVASFGSWSETIATGVTDNWTWNTANNAASLYSQIPNNNNGSGTLTLHTYNGGTHIGTKSIGFTLKVVNSNPTTGTWDYLDTNSAVIALTGNNQYLIKGKSTLRVRLTGAASAKNYATLGTNAYTVSYNGTTLYANGGVALPRNFDVGTVNGNSTSISVKDSRNNSSATTLTFPNMLTYNKPVISTVAVSRINPNDTGVNAHLSISGTYTQFPGGYATTNSIQTLKYRYKLTTSGTWSSWVTVTPTTNASGAFTYEGNISGTFTAVSAYDFEISATDRLEESTKTGKLNSIKVALYIDIENNIVGIGSIPENPTNGKAYYNGAEIATL